jgi:hypothetical protein
MPIQRRPATMTRRAQKKEERRTLDKLLSFLSIAPEKIDDKDETPDFMLEIFGRTIGVEVTTYRSDETVAVDGKKHKRRTVEAEEKRFLDSAKIFREKQADLTDIYVLFQFKNFVPSKSERPKFFAEIHEFVRSKRKMIGNQFVDCIDYTSPLMMKYLKPIGGIVMRVCEDYEWESNINYGFILDHPDQAITGIVAAKSVIYRNADEFWLVIDSSGLPSETALPINGVNKFNANHVLAGNLKSSPFSTVYFFTAMGLFQWDRLGHRWKELRR